MLEIQSCNTGHIKSSQLSNEHMGYIAFCQGKLAAALVVCCLASHGSDELHPVVSQQILDGVVADHIQIVLHQLHHLLPARQQQCFSLYPDGSRPAMLPFILSLQTFIL